jgi:hypothetical protein
MTVQASARFLNRRETTRQSSRRVIARSVATWQSIRRFSRPKRRGKLQGRMDCHGPAALAMTVLEEMALKGVPLLSDPF